MVFTSIVNLIRTRGPDEFWRKRKMFKLAAVSVNYIHMTLDFLNNIHGFSISTVDDEIVIR